MRSMRSLIQKSAAPHEPYSLPHLINESIELVEAQAKRQQIQIQLDSNIQELLLNCDAVMLKQVLFNLLRNALEAMAFADTTNTAASTWMEAQLKIVVTQDPLYVTISITDQGTGILETDKLFQAFYTTKSEGMGLGLAICRTVVENHGGKIWAENNTNGGATFSFRLPLNAQSTSSTKTLNTAIPMTSPNSIQAASSTIMQATSTVNL